MVLNIKGNIDSLDDLYEEVIWGIWLVEILNEIIP